MYPTIQRVAIFECKPGPEITSTNSMLKPRFHTVLILTSPVADGSNLAMSGNNRFFAFLGTLDHVVQESIGCNDYPRLAFS